MRLSFITAGLLCFALAVPAAFAQEAELAAETPSSTVEIPAEAETPLEEATEQTPAEEPVADPEEPEADDAAEAGEPESVEEADGDAAKAPTEEPVAAEDPAAEGTDWSGLVERAPAFFALTHHAAVHLPIALWLFGAFFVVVGVVVPSWRNQIPLACLIGGMLTSVAAAASGWWYAEYEYGDEWAWGDMIDRERLAEGIVEHRWIAVALVVSSLILSVIALVSQAKKSRGLGFVWRVGLLLLAAAVSYEGHIGGELIMGEGFLEEAFQEWVSPEE